MTFSTLTKVVTRTVKILYRHDTRWRKEIQQHYEDPVRKFIKLIDIEDTSLLDDIKTVQKASQIVPEPLMDRVFDDAAAIDEIKADETKEYIEAEKTAPKESISTEIPIKERKRRLNKDTGKLITGNISISIHLRDSERSPA